MFFETISSKPVKLETTHLGGSYRPTMPDDLEPGLQTGLLAAPWRLLMQIGGSSPTTVGMEVADCLVVGRSDPTANYHPNLDLTPYGGQEHGVSRRHARVLQQDKALYIEDLGSVNGTRINGFELEANRPYRLRDGDELEFGRVRVTVRFVRAPY